MSKKKQSQKQRRRRAMRNNDKFKKLRSQVGQIHSRNLVGEFMEAVMKTFRHD